VYLIPNSAVVDRPFHLHPAPGEIVTHPAWHRARTAVLAALARGEATVLFGPPGVGKTLLLRDVAQTLRLEGRPARLMERWDALGLALGPHEILLVDEARSLGADVLARLCATQTPFALATLPDFTEQLTGLPRRVTPVTLEPLSPEEVARFVAARLATAGRRRDMLEPEAVLALAQHSAGLPRLVNVLGSAAMFLANLERAPRVCQRHVDEAASLRGVAEEDVAFSFAVEREPVLAEGLRVSPNVMPELARSAPQPRRPQRAALAGAAAGLGLALVGVWAVSEWRGVRPPGAQLAGGGHAVESVREEISRPPGAPSAIRDQGVEAAREEAAGPQPQDAPAFGQQNGPAASPPSSDAATLDQRPAVSEMPVVFRGSVYNETMHQGGQMSLAVRRQGSSGAVTARFEAWGGLLGSGELSGRLSEDGRLSASGRLMMGRNPFSCDLSGRVIGDRLVGSASFIRDSGGPVARSSFALTKS
jgi:hypothetical protein